MFGTASPFAAPAAGNAVAASPFQAFSAAAPPSAAGKVAVNPFAAPVPRSDSSEQQGERYGSKDRWQSGRDSWHEEKDPWHDGQDPWQTRKEARKDDWKDEAKDRSGYWREEADGKKGSSKGSAKNSGKGRGKGAKGKGYGKSWNSQGSWDNSSSQHQWGSHGADSSQWGASSDSGGGSWWGRDSGGQKDDHSGRNRGHDDKSWRRDDSQSWGKSTGKASNSTKAWLSANRRSSSWNKWERKDSQSAEMETPATSMTPPHNASAKTKQGVFGNLTWEPPKMPDMPKPEAKTQAVPAQNAVEPSEEEDASQEEEGQWEDEDWEGEEEEDNWNEEEEEEDEQEEAEEETKEDWVNRDSKNEDGELMPEDETYQGEHCEAWMPSGKGFAVVGFESKTVRDAVLRTASESGLAVCGVKLRVGVAHEEDGSSEVETDVRVAWDEPSDRVDIRSLVKFFDAERRRVAAASLNTRNFQLKIQTDSAAHTPGLAEEAILRQPASSAGSGQADTKLQKSIITIEDEAPQVRKRDRSPQRTEAASTRRALLAQRAEGTSLLGFPNEDYVKNLSAFLQEPDDVGAPSGIGLSEGSGLVGTLEEMCSAKEMKDRAEQRQLDVLEMEVGSTLENPRVDPLFAAKKYQRSAADRTYHAEDTRTLPTCARSLWHLISKVLSADLTTQVVTAVPIDYWKVYSFLRDRTRAVRVDLHLQQPWSTTTKVYIASHEICLRFEIMSMYILCEDVETTKKYDEKMAHKSCAQVMEPLLNAYGEVRKLAEQGKAAYRSPMEPAIQRYAILLLLVGSGQQQVFEQLAKLPLEILRHPAVKWAIAVVSAYAMRNYGRFLKLYKEADFMSATILFPLLNVVRQRILWLMVRSTGTWVRDKLLIQDVAQRLAFIDVESTEVFLEFHGLEVIALGTGKTVVQLPARKPHGGFDVMHDGRLAAAFNERLGQNDLPAKCAIQRQMDGYLRAKYESLQCSRTDIVLGATDPMDSYAGLTSAGLAGNAASTGSAGAIAAFGLSKNPSKQESSNQSKEEPKENLFSRAKHGLAHLLHLDRSEDAKAADVKVAESEQSMAKSSSPFKLQSPVSILSSSAKELLEPTKKESPALVRSSTQAQSSSPSGPFTFNVTTPEASSLVFGSVPSPQQPLRSTSPARKRPTDPVLQPFSDKRTKQSTSQSEDAQGDSGVMLIEQGDKPDKAESFAGVGRVSPAFASSASTFFKGDLTQAKKDDAPFTGSGFGWSSLSQDPPTEQEGKPEPPRPRESAPPLKMPQKRSSPPTVATWDELFPMPSPLTTPLSDDWEASGDVIVYLFRVGHAFLAWRNCCSEGLAWSQWAKPKRRRMESQWMKPQRLGTSRRLPEQRAVPPSPSVHVEALKALDNRLPSEAAGAGHDRDGLCVHRLAVLVPPKSSCGARGSNWSHKLTELLLPPSDVTSAHTGRPRPGEALLASSQRCSVRLLQRGERVGHPQQPRACLGVSVLEVQLAAEPAAEDWAALEKEMSAAGSVSALLHIVNAPIPTDIDTDMGLDEAHMLDWRGEAERAMLGLRALAPRLSHSQGLGHTVASKVHRLPAVAALFAVAVPCSIVPAEADGMARYVAKGVAQHVAADLASALVASHQATRELPVVAAFCVALARLREDGSVAGFTMLPGGLKEALAWSLSKGAGPYVAPPAHDLQLAARLCRHWAAKAAASRDGLVFPFREWRVRSDFEAAVDTSAAELAHLLEDLQPEPLEWSGSTSLATTRPSVARRAIEAARQQLWTLAPPFKELLAKRSPDEFWEAAKQFAKAHIGTVLSPTPSWWDATAFPTLHVEPHCALATTPQLLARQWRLNPRLRPPLTFEQARRSVVACPEPVQRSPEVLQAEPLLQRAAEAPPKPLLPPPRPTPAAQKPAGGASSAQHASAPPTRSKRPLSFDEMLRRDAAWTERLIRGVALLAVDLPGGAEV